MHDLVLNDFGTLKIYQPKEGYHFSSEPFVLSKDLVFKTPKRIVDFGSGCGIIAVIVSLNNPKSTVYAIEKNKDLRKIIEKNIKLNGIKNVEVLPSTDALETNSIDYFITNPPYFKIGSYRPSKKFFEEKFETESLDKIIGYAKRILKNKGTIRLSFHPSRFMELIQTLKDTSFGIKTIQPVYGKLNKKASFIVVEASLSSPSHVEFNPPLILDNYTI